jgi:catechol 2,3-dioxygenase-like lactoylglutathione lyase family enzyme
MQATRILESALYVDDLAQAQDFYGQVLGLELHSQLPGRHLFFHCGDGMLLIFNPRATSKSSGDIPTHGASGPGHVAFGIQEADLPNWKAHLQQHNVAIETEITWPSGGRSIYFRDPAGNSVELVTPKIWGLAHPA